MRILLVDDDFDIRYTVREVLEDEGYAVDAVTNGQEALDYLHQHQAPALILLDLNMPVMTGWEFRSQQRADASLADIPVVVISATHDVTEKATAMAVAGVLRKPVELDDLLAAVAKYAAAS